MTVIAPEDFGIWYIDCMDKPDRYRGKVVEFTGMVMKSNKFPKNYFVPGRMAMTCCGVGPVLYAESVEPAEPIKDIVQF